MSIFNDLLPKINAIPKEFLKKIDEDLKVALERLEKFDEELQNGSSSRGREKAQKDKTRITALQCINEDDGDLQAPKIGKSSSESNSGSNPTSESNGGRRASKKRNKNEVDDMLSPEIDKRQKRNASVRAQSNITKQVNVNLTAKLRRENSSDSVDKNSDKVEKNSHKADKKNVNVEKSTTTVGKSSTRGRRRKNDEKENAEPNVLAIQIKEEKLSLQPEPTDMETDVLMLTVDIPVKIELNKDDIAMPPPNVPVPKPRKGLAKDKSDDSEEETSKKRTMRTKKQPAEAMPPPPEPATRVTRAGSHARLTDTEEQPPTETRPKRTRAKKKVSVSETRSDEVDSTPTSQESVSGASSPADKPRPKRTRRGKAAEKKVQKPAETFMSPKEDPVTRPSSPVLQKNNKSKKDITSVISTTIESSVTVNSTADYHDCIELEMTRIIDKTMVINKDVVKRTDRNKDKDKTTVINKDMDKTTVINKDKDETTVINKAKTTVINKDMDKTTVINKDMDKTTVINKDMDKTMAILPNGLYNQTPVTDQNALNMNVTVVLERNNFDDIALKKPQNVVLDATVVIDKGQKLSNLTDDNSLLTDDESEQEVQTPSEKAIRQMQPSSAVKEKVQQFEELATRVTRTKTRAMAKKEEQTENQTPPDKVSKPILSAETLAKMNSLIFNGKSHQQISSSACKPRAVAPAGRSLIPSSASKLSSVRKHKEAAEETLKSSRSNDEDAKRKKEAMLEAKREQQKRKREEKMAAAAAARLQAEKERQLQLELAARERMEKQAHADGCKLERMKEAVRKKQELARKVAETEERRKAEESARMQRLADEQRKALAQRRKQIEEHEAMKKEEAIMAKEIEKRQKEYMDKQKMKQRIEDKMHTPLKTPGTPGGYHRMEPVYMADGFQYLNSDEDDEPPARPVPEWSMSKVRKQPLANQSHISQVHVDRLFTVRVHSPDLREIFPNIERNRLKRTSSAVWRTPPRCVQLRTVVE